MQLYQENSKEKNSEKESCQKEIAIPLIQSSPDDRTQPSGLFLRDYTPVGQKPTPPNFYTYPQPTTISTL
jgi:hypothetical protein